MQNKINRKEDYIVHAAAKQDTVRIMAVRTKKVVQTVRDYQDLGPAATHVLGRLLTGALMLAQDIKQKSGTLDLSIRSDGEISKIVAIADATGHVKGYCNAPHAKLLVDDKQRILMKEMIGEGYLNCVRNNDLNKPYVSQVELISGEIAQDLTYYLAVSEQIPSSMALGIKLNKEGVEEAGGLLLQVLPDATEETKIWLEKRLKGFPEISYLFSEGFTPHQIIDLLIGDPDLKYLSEQSVAYDCACTKEKMTKVLLALGKHDLEELSLDPKGIEMTCQFCNKKIHFSQAEIKKIKLQ